MNEYKINYYKCFKSCLYDWFHKFWNKLDNETIGAILCNAIFYTCTILGFPVFAVMSLISLNKKVKQIKGAIQRHDKSKINSLVRNEFILPLSKEQIELNIITEENKYIKKNKVKMTEQSSKNFNVGDELFTVMSKNTVIPFIVDRIKFQIFKGVGIREYWCDCKKHNLSLSKHFGNQRCRHNNNLFKDKADADKYCDELKKTK